MSLIYPFPKNGKKQLANIGLQKEFLHQSKPKTTFITNSEELEIKL